MNKPNLTPAQVNNIQAQYERKQKLQALRNLRNCSEAYMNRYLNYERDMEVE